MPRARATFPSGKRDLMLVVKLRCPHHPRYRPQDGEAAIRGGCAFCQRLFQLYMTAGGLQREMWEAVHTEGEEEL